jgi:hypothetical protein
MAISSIGSYLGTMDEFIDHWTAVNAAVSPAELLLAGGYALTDFSTDRDAIETALTAVQSADNSRQIAAGNRDLKKAALRMRLAQYRAAVTGILAGTAYSKSPPKLPKFTATPGVFRDALDDMANGWNHVNTDTIDGFTPPLLLAGGYALATFNTDLVDLRAAFLASTNADDDDRLTRDSRNVLLGPAKARMVQYRQAVKSILPSGSALLLNIPAVSPPPGSTPAPVNASGDWNAGTSMADLTWSASPNPNLDHYSVRTAPGPKYKAADESVVGEVDKTLTHYSTDEGLVAPGATALFRVYVVLTTANEKGSNTVGVTRAEV